MSIPHTKIFHMTNYAIACERIKSIVMEGTIEVITCDDIKEPGHIRVYRFDKNNLYGCIEERYDGEIHQ